MLVLYKNKKCKRLHYGTTMILTCVACRRNWFAYSHAAAVYGNSGCRWLLSRHSSRPGRRNDHDQYVHVFILSISCCVLYFAVLFDKVNQPVSQSVDLHNAP